MAKKKTSKKRAVRKKLPKPDLNTEKDIAMDFAVQAYKRFDKMIKAIALFGSSAKNTSSVGSDIDIIILIDDAAIQWDQELIAWYREELAKLVVKNKYKRDIHITSTKITTWWNDLLKGDPVVINVLRYGEALIDVGGFFNPLKALLIQGKIKPTYESIYNALQRAPEHFRRSRQAELNAIEGLFWAMVDSAQAALMAAKKMPPSPEHIPGLLNDTFVADKRLKKEYVVWFRDLYILHRKIVHGEINDIKGKEIDEWQERTESFIAVMVRLVNKMLGD